MVAPIGPGDFVECVDDRGCGHIVPLGSVHMVEALADFHGTPCLILKGVVHPLGYRKVRADCFRPIYRPNDSIIAGLLKPVDDLVEA